MLVVDDPAAVTQALAIGHVAGAGEPGDQHRDRHDEARKENAPEGLLPGLGPAKIPEKAQRQHRRLDHPDQIGQVIAQVHKAHPIAVEQAQQTERGDHRKAQQQRLFPLRLQQGDQRQDQQQGEPDVARDGAVQVLVKIGHGVQQRLGRDQQHKPMFPKPGFPFLHRSHPS